MPIAINLVSKSFASKTSAIEFFKQMLGRYPDLGTLCDDDQLLLVELVTAYHPDAAEKIGVGVKRVYKDIAPEGLTSCFYLERIDNTTTDVSYRWCIRCAQ